MTRALSYTAALALAAVAAACHHAPPNDNAIRAVAFLLDSAGREVGQVHLTEQPGAPGIMYEITISRGATTGQHGIHFHTVGSCDPANQFSSAGGHFNPYGKHHGLLAADGPHAGDLEAITIDSFGHATFLAGTPRVTLSPGPTSLLDDDGSSVVLHALPDDQRTDPSGNSGARIACGVIKRV